MKFGPPGLALAAAAALFCVSVAVAQTAKQPASPQFKNLQVFPKDITRPQLLSNMKFFAQSLGVRCTHCHVGTEGQPLSTFDFASDAKKEKQTARKMLAMVHRINREDFGVTDFANVKVTCFTCHRGSTKPLAFPPPQTTPGTPAAAKTERGAS